MSNNTKAEPFPTLAEHWARKGPDEIAKMQATIDLARQILVSEEVQPYAEGENPFEIPVYPWEITEPRRDAPRRIFFGTVSDLATGSGHTVYFTAGLARDVDGFRRQLADHIGHTLAHGATVSHDLEGFPFAATFISRQIRQKLERLDEGKNAPADFFFLSQWSENRS